MRRRRFQRESLQLRKHGKSRVWVVLYYDDRGERCYSTLGWASEMNKGEADEKGRNRCSSYRAELTPFVAVLDRALTRCL